MVSTFVSINLIDYVRKNGKIYEDSY
ncbi:hypothetical protein RSC2_03221 [Bacillus paralicheniformis]|nr:hypothetical protein RSC1_01373 [Bacillus paralicheniformis]BCE11425.1 hypothetical protein RSC2_03221 [Bacillus paralicheniformis]BCE13015.1 hypothetical protein RSC3_00371 [Bacillus paralicheniformis]